MISRNGIMIKSIKVDIQLIQTSNDNKENIPDNSLRRNFILSKVKSIRDFGKDITNNNNNNCEVKKNKVSDY